jgi:RpiB/LacA/LacB family sugar-phosphate isomerase
VLQLPPREWAAELDELRSAGFQTIDLADAWLAPGAMGKAALIELRAVINHCDLALAGVSLIRRSVIDPVEGGANFDYTIRSIEAAAFLGAPVVSIGLQRPLSCAQKRSQFWMVRASEDDRDDQTWDLAVKRIGQAAARAAALGLEISLELHEGTLLDSPAGALRIIDGVRATNVGINPDLGNLVRVPRPLATGWVELLRESLPFMNYWHVKNYIRLEYPDLKLVLSYPTKLAFGVIDYRQAVRLAIAHGYRGPVCIEHYEGDSIEAIASGRRYLEEIMRRIETDSLGLAAKRETNHAEEGSHAIAVGSDAAGAELRRAVANHLRERGYKVCDHGVDDSSRAYPSVAFEVAQLVADGVYSRAVLCCGTGIGVAIAANKVPGVYAANCHDVYSAQRARKSNNAQILTMGERVIGQELGLAIVDAWLASEFEGGGSTVKVAEIAEYEKEHLSAEAAE